MQQNFQRQISKSASNQEFLNMVQNTGFQGPTMYSSKKLEHMNCILEPNSQLGGLYIGDIISTVKPGILQSGEIGAILACSFDQSHFKYKSRTDYQAQQKIIDTHDSMEYPIKMHFDTAFDFIEKNRLNKKNVLVHCHAGVSRSGTMVIAYLIRKNKWTLNQALNFVKSKRQRVKPNANFLNQLQEYQNQFVKKNEQKNIKPTPFSKNEIIFRPQAIINSQNINYNSHFQQYPAMRQIRYQTFDKFPQPNHQFYQQIPQFNSNTKTRQVPPQLLYNRNYFYQIPQNGVQSQRNFGQSQKIKQMNFNTPEKQKIQNPEINRL